MWSKYSFLRYILPIAFSVLFMVFGLMAVFVFSDQQADKEKKCTEKTQGIVTYVKMKHDDDHTDYDISVQFAIGKEQFTYSTISGKYFSKGDKVTVMYDPDRHANYYVKELSSSPLTIRIVGGLFALIGLIVCIIMIKNMLVFRKNNGVINYNIIRRY